MKEWVSVFSDKEDFTESINDCLVSFERTGVSEPTLIFAFISPLFSGFTEDLIQALDRHFPSAHVVGCCASAVMSGLEEVNSPFFISLFAATFSKVNIESVHLDFGIKPGEDASPRQWFDYTGIEKQGNQSFIILGDPYTFGLEEILSGLDYAYGTMIIGGFASGMQFKGETVLFTDQGVYHNGAILLSLSGNLDVIPLVAQGCRPVGGDFTITKCDDVVLESMDGTSPMLCLKAISDTLDELDKQLLHQSLFLGVEKNSAIIDVHKNDYLIRNIRGLNPENGAIVVGDHLELGQSVRFHVRDPESSRSELIRLVNSAKVKLSSRRCKGMLVFSCLGRTAEFYGEYSVDSSILASLHDAAAVGGFFCSGEVGPLHGSTYIHGYTACAALFYERNR